MRAIWPAEQREPETMTGGESVWTAIGRPISQVTPRMRGYLRRDLKIAIDEEDPVGFWYQNEDEFGAFADAAAAMVQMLIARSRVVKEPGLIATEWDQLRKFVIWRSKPNGWWCIPEGLKSSINNGDERLWDDAATAVLKAYSAKADRRTLVESAIAMNRIPATTHKGWPTHGSGPDLAELDAHATVGLAIRQGLVTYAGAVERMKAISGVDYGPVAIAFSRTQGIAPKWQTGYQSVGGWLQSTYETKNNYPRTRTVWGVPTWMNAIIRENMGMMKGLIRSTPHHDPNPDSALSFISQMRKAPGTTTFSEDISGYDQSVGEYLMRAYNRSAVALGMVVEESFSSRGVADALDALVDLPVLAPRMSDAHEGYEYARKGRIISGSSDTTTRGTLINVMRTWICAKVTSGLSWTALTEAWRTGRWSYVIWGDDSVITVPKAWASKWDDVSASLGFKTSAVPGVVFLMRFYPQDGSKPYGLATRAFINTINKEKRLEPQSMAVARLGLKQRQLMAEDNPVFDIMDWAMRSGSQELRKQWVEVGKTGLRDLEQAVAREVISTRQALALEQDGVSSKELSMAVDEALAKGHAYSNLLRLGTITPQAFNQAIEVMAEKAQLTGVAA